MAIKKKEKYKNYCKVIELNKVDNVYKLQINLTIRYWLMLIFLVFPSHLVNSKIEYVSLAISSLGVL